MLGAVPVSDDPYGTLQLAKLASLHDLPCFAEQGIRPLVEHHSKCLAAPVSGVAKGLCFGKRYINRLFDQHMPVHIYCPRE